MPVKKKFEHHFSEENLIRLYKDKVSLSEATGIDNLNQKSFFPTLEEQTHIISDKVLKGSFKFTKYKLKLISKGRGKVPREISIPTIRDRIALRALCNFLVECYKDQVISELPQNIVKKIKTEIRSEKYNGFIKLDVSNFYPTIKHDEILKKLQKKISNPEIITFIKESISTPTVLKSHPGDKKPTLGVPQGLSISNILASIYLLEIDKQLMNDPNIAYHRYVDDIFIMCTHESVKGISSDVIKKFEEIGLKIHKPNGGSGKSVLGKINEGFDYLGYQFKGDLISPRATSIEKLKDSIVSIFTSHKHAKHPNKNFLLWRLNLRITGCVFENKSKGWMFFFLEINNETILHNLDRHIKHLVDRFQIDIKPQCFVRSYYEIMHSKHRTTYIPNFDRYPIKKMEEVLVDYFKFEAGSLSDEGVKLEFKKRISKQTKDLLTDVQNFS
jgi:retron-type reverse transcriptase